MPSVTVRYKHPIYNARRYERFKVLLEKSGFELVTQFEHFQRFLHPARPKCFVHIFETGDEEYLVIAEETDANDRFLESPFGVLG
jgi:hypothetical protein